MILRFWLPIGVDVYSWRCVVNSLPIDRKALSRRGAFCGFKTRRRGLTVRAVIKKSQFEFDND